MGTPDVPSPLTCEGPGEGGAPCGRTVRAQVEGRPLCASHYQHARRGWPHTPLGLGRPARARLPGVLVSWAAHGALEARGPSVYRATVDVVEEWAERARKMQKGKK